MLELAPKLVAPSLLVEGDRILVTNDGKIRRAMDWQHGTHLPPGSRIQGTRIDVPAWWWWLHFGEVLQ